MHRIQSWLTDAVKTAIPLVALLVLIPPASPFLLAASVPTTRGSSYLNVQHDECNNGDFRDETTGLDPPNSIQQDYLYLERFRRRKNALELRLAACDLAKPPNPFLGECEFVNSVIDSLKSCQQCDVLVQSSTERWRRVLCRSVGVPSTISNEVLANTLRPAMGRSTSQFGILLSHGSEELDYNVVFPTEPLNYGDGTCWIECRLRNKCTDELLVVLGWALQQRSSDESWLVDGIDWQDFREAFRPGIGREEWERICG